MRDWKNWCCFFIGLLVFIPFPLYAIETELASEGNLPDKPLDGSFSKKPGIFISGVGEGFRTGTKVVGLSLGVTKGLEIFGSEVQHDLDLVSVSYGRMIGKVKGVEHWYQGNWEVRRNYWAALSLIRIPAQSSD